MIYIFISLIAYSVGILFSTYANRNADVSLASLIITAASVTIPLALVLAKTTEGPANSKAGLAAAMAAGLLISLFTFTLGKSFDQNNVAIVVPIIFGGSIVLTSIAGIFLFKEKIVPLQAAGLLLVSVGLALIVYSRLKA